MNDWQKAGRGSGGPRIDGNHPVQPHGARGHDDDDAEPRRSCAGAVLVRSLRRGQEAVAVAQAAAGASSECRCRTISMK